MVTVSDFRRRRSSTRARKTTAAVGATLMQWVSRAYAAQIPCPITTSYYSSIGASSSNIVSCEIEAGGTFVDFGNFSNSANLFVSGDLENFFYGMSNASGGLITVQESGSFLNEAGAVFTNSDRFSNVGATTNRGVFLNNGMVTNRSPFTNNGQLNQFSGEFTNYDTFSNLDDANGTGSLSFTGGSVTNDGTISNESTLTSNVAFVNSGSLTNDSQITLNANSYFSNLAEGEVESNASGSIKNYGDFDNDGSLTIRDQGSGFESYGSFVNGSTGALFLEGGRLYNAPGATFMNDGGYVSVDTTSVLENSFTQTSGITFVTGLIEKQDNGDPVVFSGGGLYGGVQSIQGPYLGSIRNVEIQQGTIVSPGRPGFPDVGEGPGRLRSVDSLSFDGTLRIDLVDEYGGLGNDVLEAPEITFGPNALALFDNTTALGPISIGDKFTFLESDQINNPGNLSVGFVGYETQLNTIVNGGTTQLELEIVPEPGIETGLLMGVGATGLLAGQRRRRLGGDV